MYPSNQPCPSAPPASLGIPIGTAGPYYNQPQPQMIVYQPPVKWSTGLCGCADDCGNCCMTLWCPCVTFGRVAEIVDRGSTSCGASGSLYELILCFTGLQWIYSCTYRSKMRAQYNLVSSPCNDRYVHFCCEYCALCQEYRELKNRGYDLTVGWQPNMERQAQRATLPPPTQPGMMR